jgi:spore germination protein YaaH
VSAKRSAQDPGHPRSALYDYPALAEAADHIFVMAWGMHWQNSGAGPLADWAWFKGVVNYVAQQPDRQRYVIGVPLYGFDWPAGRTGKANENADLVRRAARVGATPQFDPAARESQFSYTDPGGRPHEAWFMPAQGVADRVAHARGLGFGVGVWRLGREDQAVWSSIG